MNANWVGYEDLHKRCLDLPHYGNGNDEADDMVRQCYRWWVDIANQTPSSLGGHFRCSAISVTSHQPGGALCGAMPDGRRRKDCQQDVLHLSRSLTSALDLGPSSSSYHAIVAPAALLHVYQNAVPAGTVALPSQSAGRKTGPHFPPRQ